MPASWSTTTLSSITPLVVSAASNPCAPSGRTGRLLWFGTPQSLRRTQPGRLNKSICTRSSMLKYSNLLSFKQSLLEFWSPGAERCGVIKENLDVLEVTNRSENPEYTFAFDVEVLDDGPVATWHTHPSTSANLSIEDYRFFQSWPEMLHFIVGHDEVRCYQVQNGIVFCVDDEADYSPRVSQETVQQTD